MADPVPDRRVRRALLVACEFAILDLVFGVLLLFLSASVITDWSIPDTPLVEGIPLEPLEPTEIAMEIVSLLLVTLSGAGLATGGYLLLSGAGGRYGRIRLGLAIATACTASFAGSLPLGIWWSQAVGAPMDPWELCIDALVCFLLVLLPATPWLLFGRTYRALASGDAGAAGPGPS
ncbi:MAG: hypothetical protein L0216_14395 [Planctomycetales bacterium]|nr:hypothetical protein [Planctomycetales bacterium]